MKPVTFDIPASPHWVPCRGCAELVVWIVTVNNRRMPVNPDGTSHFSNCPQANAFRRPKK